MVPQVDDALLVDAGAAVARRVGVLVDEVVPVGGVGAVAKLGPSKEVGYLSVNFRLVG